MSITGIILLVLFGIILIGYSIFCTVLIVKLQKKIINLTDWMKYYTIKTLFIKKMMQEIDIRGSFESDDEVGITFKELKELIYNLGIDENQETSIYEDITSYLNKSDEEERKKEKR